MSDKATPIDQWSLDQSNYTAHERSVRVKLAQRMTYGPGVILRVQNEENGRRGEGTQMRLNPEQARAVATMLLYTADQAEKQTTA